MSKRPDGALENDVLNVLWNAPTPMTPADVNAELGGELAYTSVATILSRLHGKGLVTRTPVGRAFAYSAAVDEAELAAQRLGEVIASVSDRADVLARFVGKLSKRDVNALRKVIDRSSTR